MEHIIPNLLSERKIKMDSCKECIHFDVCKYCEKVIALETAQKYYFNNVVSIIKNSSLVATNVDIDYYCTSFERVKENKT